MAPTPYSHAPPNPNRTPSSSPALSAPADYPGSATLSVDGPPTVIVTPNPNGIPSSSPGLRRSPYPGFATDPSPTTLKGLASIFSRCRRPRETTTQFDAAHYTPRPHRGHQQRPTIPASGPKIVVEISSQIVYVHTQRPILRARSLTSQPNTNGLRPQALAARVRPNANGIILDLAVVPSSAENPIFAYFWNAPITLEAEKTAQFARSRFHKCRFLD
jgi:hypothetical protein